MKDKLVEGRKTNSGGPVPGGGQKKKRDEKQIHNAPLGKRE